MTSGIIGTKANMMVLQRERDADVCEVRAIHPERVLQALDTMLPDAEYRALADTFQVLADPTRAKIIYNLLHQELCTCDLAAIVGTSESAVSQHLRVLRQLHLTKSRRQGKVVYHSLDDTHISVLLSVCLEHVRDKQVTRSK